MEIYKLESDLIVFGLPVTTFPEGISQTFEKLANMLPQGYQRPYYGISYLTDNGIVYIAATQEMVAGEAAKYSCERHIVKKGDYAKVNVHNWRRKLHTIKDIFHELLQTVQPDQYAPCIELYKTDDEMECMVKLAGTIPTGS